MKGWSYLITLGSNASTRLLQALLIGFLIVGSDSAHSQAEEEIRETETPIELAPPLEHLRVGERLDFHGRWLGIPVGQGWIEVKALTELNGRPAYLIEAEASSNTFLSMFYPVRDSLRSYLDVKTLRPLQSEKIQREGHYRAEEIVTFDYERRTVTYRSLLNQSVKEVPIPTDVHDILGAFYWLRLQPVDPSRSLFLNIYSDEKIYHTEIKPLKTVTLELLWRGTFPCLLIEPLAAFKGILVKRGQIWFYVSADAKRVPLFIKISTPWGLITGVIDQHSLDAAR